MNTATGGAKSKQTQIDKYGGLEGYQAEMQRRVSLRKNHGKNGAFAIWKRTGQMHKFKEIAVKSAASRRKS